MLRLARPIIAASRKQFKIEGIHRATSHRCIKYFVTAAKPNPAAPRTSPNSQSKPANGSSQPKELNFDLATLNKKYSSLMQYETTAVFSGARKPSPQDFESNIVALIKARRFSDSLKLFKKMRTIHPDVLMQESTVKTIVGGMGEIASFGESAETIDLLAPIIQKYPNMMLQEDEAKALLSEVVRKAGTLGSYFWPVLIRHADLYSPKQAADLLAVALALGDPDMIRQAESFAEKHKALESKHGTAVFFVNLFKSRRELVIPKWFENRRLFLNLNSTALTTIMKLVAQRAFFDSREDVADDVLKLCAQRKLFDEAVYSLILQVYLQAGSQAKVDAMAAAMRANGVNLNADHFLSNWTSVNSQGSAHERALQYVFSKPEIEMTADAISLAIKHFAGKGELASAAALYDKILSEFWPNVSKFTLHNMVFFLNESAMRAFLSYPTSSQLQAAVCDQIARFCELINELLKSSLASQQGREIAPTRTPRLLRWVLYFMEFTGPIPALLDFFNTEFTKTDQPSVNHILMYAFLMYAGALQVLTPAEITNFTSKHKVRPTKENYYRLENGSIVNDFADLWKLAEPRLRKLDPKEAAATLRSLQINIPQRQNLE